MNVYVVHVDVAHRDGVLVDVETIDETLEALLDLAVDLVDGRQVAEYLLALGLVENRPGHLVGRLDWLFEELFRRKKHMTLRNP